MVANDEVANFLVEVAGKGDQICVAVPSPASTVSRGRDEEVGMEGDDISQMRAEDEVSQTKAKPEEENFNLEKGEPAIMDEKEGGGDDKENEANA